MKMARMSSPLGDQRTRGGHRGARRLNPQNRRRQSHAHNSGLRASKIPISPADSIPLPAQSIAHTLDADPVRISASTENSSRPLRGSSQRIFCPCSFAHASVSSNPLGPSTRSRTFRPHCLADSIASRRNFSILADPSRGLTTERSQSSHRTAAALSWLACSTSHSARSALGRRGGQRQLQTGNRTLLNRPHHDRDLFFIQRFNRPPRRPAAAVKNFHLITRRQPQDRPRMVRLVLRQRHAAGGKIGAIKAIPIHGRSPKFCP